MVLLIWRNFQQPFIQKSLIFKDLLNRIMVNVNAGLNHQRKRPVGT